MMGFFDDNVPFRKKVKDVADKIEEGRKARIERNRETGVGTLKGLESLIANRKLQSATGGQDAKRNSY